MLALYKLLSCKEALKSVSSRTCVAFKETFDEVGGELLIRYIVVQWLAIPCDSLDCPTSIAIVCS